MRGSEVAAGIADVLVQGGQLGEVGLIALEDDLLDGSLIAADHHRGNRRGAALCEGFGGLPRIGHSERARGEGSAGSEVTDHPYVAGPAICEQGLGDMQNGLLSRGLQSMLQRRDFMHDRQRPIRPIHRFGDAVQKIA